MPSGRTRAKPSRAPPQPSTTSTSSVQRLSPVEPSAVRRASRQGNRHPRLATASRPGQRQQPPKEVPSLGNLVFPAHEARPRPGQAAGYRPGAARSKAQCGEPRIRISGHRTPSQSTARRSPLARPAGAPASPPIPRASAPCAPPLPTGGNPRSRCSHLLPTCRSEIVRSSPRSLLSAQPPDHRQEQPYSAERRIFPGSWARPGGRGHLGARGECRPHRRCRDERSVSSAKRS